MPGCFARRIAGKPGASRVRRFRLPNRPPAYSPWHFAIATMESPSGATIKSPTGPRPVVALTSDGGRTWTLPTGKPPDGYRSAVTYVPAHRVQLLVAVGPTGTDLTADGGESWTPLGTMGFHAVACAAQPIPFGESARMERSPGFADRSERNRSVLDRDSFAMTRAGTELVRFKLPATGCDVSV